MPPPSELTPARDGKRRPTAARCVSELAGGAPARRRAPPAACVGWKPSGWMSARDVRVRRARRSGSAGAAAGSGRSARRRRSASRGSASRAAAHRSSRYARSPRAAGRGRRAATGAPPIARADASCASCRARPRARSAGAARRIHTARSTARAKPLRTTTRLRRDRRPRARSPGCSIRCSRPVPPTRRAVGASSSASPTIRALRARRRRLASRARRRQVAEKARLGERRGGRRSSPARGPPTRSRRNRDAPLAEGRSCAAGTRGFAWAGVSFEEPSARHRRLFRSAVAADRYHTGSALDSPAPAAGFARESASNRGGRREPRQGVDRRRGRDDAAARRFAAQFLRQLHGTKTLWLRPPTAAARAARLPAAAPARLSHFSARLRGRPAPRDQRDGDGGARAEERRAFVVTLRRATGCTCRHSSSTPRAATRRRASRSTCGSPEARAPTLAELDALPLPEEKWGHRARTAAPLQFLTLASRAHRRGRRSPTAAGAEPSALRREGTLALARAEPVDVGAKSCTRRARASRRRSAVPPWMPETRPSSTSSTRTPASAPPLATREPAASAQAARRLDGAARRLGDGGARVPSRATCCERLRVRRGGRRPS